MDRLFARTKALITKDVEKDDLEMNSSGVSPSAVETKSNFKIVSKYETMIFILRLSWLPPSMCGKDYLRVIIHLNNLPYTSIVYV